MKYSNSIEIVNPKWIGPFIFEIFVFLRRIITLVSSLSISITKNHNLSLGFYGSKSVLYISVLKFRCICNLESLNYLQYYCYEEMIVLRCRLKASIIICYVNIYFYRLYRTNDGKSVLMMINECHTKIHGYTTEALYI